MIKLFTGLSYFAIHFIKFAIRLNFIFILLNRFLLFHSQSHSGFFFPTRSSLGLTLNPDHYLHHSLSFRFHLHLNLPSLSFNPLFLDSSFALFFIFAPSLTSYS